MFVSFIIEQWKNARTRTHGLQKRVFKCKFYPSNKQNAIVANRIAFRDKY